MTATLVGREGDGGAAVVARAGRGVAVAVDTTLRQHLAVGGVDEATVERDGAAVLRAAGEDEEETLLGRVALGIFGGEVDRQGHRVAAGDAGWKAGLREHRTWVVAARAEGEVEPRLVD